MKKPILKTLNEYKEEMTYDIHARTDIVSLKNLHEKLLGKLTKGSAILEN
jgi:hypothetical protein